MDQGSGAQGDGAPPPAAMARLVDERDWTLTPLGPPGHWPLALRLALDLMLASRFPMCLMWGEERILLYNDGYATILGARHPEALGRPVEEAWPEIWGQIAPLVRRTYAGEALWFEDLPMQVARNGHPERAWFTFSFSPLRDALGVVRGMLNTVVETTSRVTAEAALAEREGRLRLMADALPQIVWFAGPDGKVSWFNRRWHEFAGVPRGEGPPDHAARAGIIHPEDLPRASARWAQAVATGEPYETEYRFREAATGAWRWHLGRALPARDAGGAILAWYGTATDIHDQREAREVLARTQDELERRVRERTAELLRAEQKLRHAEKLRALGQLTGSLAHDFGNVLQVVDSGIHLLADEGLSAAERGEVAQGVGASLENARRLIRQLMAFARQQPLEPASFDLNARLGAMRELLRHSLGSRIALETDFAEGLPPVVLDPAQLETAVLNLVMNARDAMPQGGRLALRTALVEGRPALTVADTGEGMEAATLARLFEPFFTTKPAGRGTGLGLAQVHGFVTQSGGEVRVDSAPGQGTAFTLLF